jgi:hypothetical protein
VAHAAVDFTGGKTRVDQDGGDSVGDIDGVAPAAAAEDADGQAVTDIVRLIKQVQFYPLILECPPLAGQ